MPALILAQLSKSREMMVPIRLFASSLSQPLYFPCAGLLRCPQVKNTERALVLVLTQMTKSSRSGIDEATFDTIKITPITRRELIDARGHGVKVTHLLSVASPGNVITTSEYFKTL